MKLVHWPLTGGLLHLVQQGGAWVGCSPAQSPPCCTKGNSPPDNGQCTNQSLHCYMMVSCSAVLMWHLKGYNMYTTFKNRMQLIHILTTLNILWQQNSCLTSVFTAGIARISTSRKTAVPCCTSRSSRTISVVPPRVMMYLGFTAAAFTVTVTIWILGLLPSPHLSNRHHQHYLKPYILTCFGLVGSVSTGVLHSSDVVR